MADIWKQGLALCIPVATVLGTLVDILAFIIFYIGLYIGALINAKTALSMPASKLWKIVSKRLKLVSRAPRKMSLWRSKVTNLASHILSVRT